MTNAYRDLPLQDAAILVTTTNECSGYSITKYLGIVRGITVRALSFGQGFVGGFKSLGGGNIEEYVEVCDLARQEAFRQMMHQAHLAGAQAVIGMRYDATAFATGSEVIAYGTAVLLEKIK